MALFLLFILQYKTVPRNYDAIYHRMTCQGARVLALGYKKLGEVNAKEVWYTFLSQSVIECFVTIAYN